MTSEARSGTLADVGPLRWTDDPGFYPDVIAAGSLVSAIQEIAAAHAIDLPGLTGPREIHAPQSAHLPTEDGYVNVAVALRERWFIADLWCRGVRLAWGKTQDLAPIARAMEAWQDGRRLAEVQQRSPFIEYNRMSEAHERGPADAVAERWRELRVDRELMWTKPIIEAAFAEPKLRQLFAFTSHWELCFSRCTGYPFSRDVPSIKPLEDDRYQVHRPGRDVVNHVVNTPKEAVDLVVAHLPADCGPAVAGTAMDLPAPEPRLRHF